MIFSDSQYLDTNSNVNYGPLDREGCPLALFVADSSHIFLMLST